MGKDPMGLQGDIYGDLAQMAEHYKDYPDNVYFGLLNEPNEQSDTLSMELFSNGCL